MGGALRRHGYHRRGADVTRAELMAAQLEAAVADIREAAVELAARAEVLAEMIAAMTAPGLENRPMTDREAMARLLALQAERDPATADLTREAEPPTPYGRLGRAFAEAEAQRRRHG